MLTHPLHRSILPLALVVGLAACTKAAKADDIRPVTVWWFQWAPAAGLQEEQHRYETRRAPARTIRLFRPGLVMLPAAAGAGKLARAQLVHEC